MESIETIANIVHSIGGCLCVECKYGSGFENNSQTIVGHCHVARNSILQIPKNKIHFCSIGEVKDPNKHGKWIRMIMEKFSGYECSSCGYRIAGHHDPYPEDKICPRCLAQMDLR